MKQVILIRLNTKNCVESIMDNIKKVIGLDYEDKVEIFGIPETETFLYKKAYKYYDKLIGKDKK